MNSAAGSSENVFLRLLQDNTAVQVVVALAALVGATTTIYLTIRSIHRWYVEHFAWAHRVEADLEALRPNVVIEEFIDRLGRPRIVHPSRRNTERQYIFSGRGYWVQAVVDDRGIVVMFAVTACDPKLRPKWTLWNGRDRYEEVCLNQKPLVDSSSSLTPSAYRWFFSGATANSFAYAFFGGGNPSNYLSYAWGYNDACMRRLAEDLDAADMQVMSDPRYWSSGHSSPTGRLPPPALSLPEPIATLFSRALINTFAIFGIGMTVDDLPEEFQIGADRILTRTL